MTNENLEKRFSDIESILLKLMEEKPSTFRRLLDWAKPYIVPFVLGVIVGSVCLPSFPFSFMPSSIERQAAAGGAVIPFGSGKQSPNHSALPPTSWMPESSDPPLTNISLQPSPSSRQADNGETKSTKLFRPVFRRTR